ncbi:TetR/AcrR family transcriptional regulator [Nocardia sp. XZ_19_385]|uniref:TetR/AcrR family transcriptional regulator n=1 Tax=Nocardia sp. XZ_19_385 TaxID=2769488 RepID=UPI00281667E1|nr:TetR/AcrR family transcriptional regulator [Nocardia sp. XZ_19_385]
MPAGPRERLLESAIELVREQGVPGAGLAALLERSNASRNSLYQHFPSGKAELVAEATKVAGERMSAVFDRVTATGTPDQWLAGLVGWWKKALRNSDYAAGCPVVSAALAEAEPGVQAAAGVVFDDWNDRLATALAAEGVPADRARALASLVLSAMEGAIVQARAMKSVRPLDDVQETLGPLLTLSSDQRPRPIS